MIQDDLPGFRYRVRLIQLLSAAEQASLSPIALDKLHAFAFLADVLSPVWHLRPFEDRIGRTDRPPYYPDLQTQLDVIVCMGMVEPSALSYVPEDDGEGARFRATYALRYESKFLGKILAAMEADPDLVKEQTFLNALAEALASLPDDDIARAASKDLVYQKLGSDNEDYVDLNSTAGASITTRAVARFDAVFPGAKITPARRLYMYANYLGRRAHG